MAWYDEDGSHRVDKDEATAALQQLFTLIPQHHVPMAIELFTTVHEFIVLAPTPLDIRLTATVEHTSAESTNSEGYDTATGIRPLDLTGPGEPFAEGTHSEDAIEELRRHS